MYYPISNLVLKGAIPLPAYDFNDLNARDRGFVDPHCRFVVVLIQAHG